MLFFKFLNQLSLITSRFTVYIIFLRTPSHAPPLYTISAYISSMEGWNSAWMHFRLSLKAAVTSPDSGVQVSGASVIRVGISNRSRFVFFPCRDRTFSTACSMVQISWLIDWLICLFVYEGLFINYMIPQCTLGFLFPGKTISQEAPGFVVLLPSSMLEIFFKVTTSPGTLISKN